MSRVDGGARPRLAAGVRLRVDHVTGKTLLLRPEQGFELQGSAVEILRLCTAALTVNDIVDRLAVAHPTSARDAIAADVERLLADLGARRLVELVPS